MPTTKGGRSGRASTKKGTSHSKSRRKYTPRAGMISSLPSRRGNVEDRRGVRWTGGGMRKK